MASNNGLSADLARQLLELKFSERDRLRMHELATKNKEGTLTKRECDELDNYVSVGDLLAILQSKARKLLSGAPMRPVGPKSPSR
jgi:hypothetical protein